MTQSTAAATDVGEFWADLRAALDAAQVVPAAPSQSYAEWRDFYESRITQWMTADELRADVGRLSSVDAPSPMLLLVHAMRLLDMPAAPAAPSVPAVVPCGCREGECESKPTGCRMADEIGTDAQ